MVIATPNSPVTNVQFQKAMRQMRKDFKKDIADVTDAIVSAMDEMSKQNQEEHKKTRRDLAELRQEVRSTKSHLHDDINGLKTDIATAPTRTEFNQLKNRVYSQ